MSNAHKFHPSILREYDVRGTVGKTLSPDDARALGRAFGTMAARKGAKTVAVGYDGRVSSPAMSAALVEGLLSTGLNVTQIGLGPTPMLYFAVYHLEVDAGVMVTGSHNPPDYNGFKMMLAPHLPGGGSVFGEAIRELGEIAARGDFEEGKGTVDTTDISDAYVARLVQDIGSMPTLKVAWDAGNGATGEILKKLTEKLPGTHIRLFDTIDGTFPNHHPDPTQPENLRDLQQAIADQACDLGIGFDGDGDRIGAVDGKGRIVAGDQLLAIYAADVLQDNPGATIIADVKASQTLFDEIARLGGKPLMWKTGHSLIKTKMKETHAPLAGEMSGHIFFADKYYGYDDALYCAVRLLAQLGRSGKTLAQLRDKLPNVVNTPEIRFQAGDERKFEIVREVKDRLQKSGAKVNDVDGVRVMTEDGWWLLRASNTQDVLVARAEGRDEAALARLTGQIAEQLKLSGLDFATKQAAGH